MTDRKSSEDIESLQPDDPVDGLIHRARAFVDQRPAPDFQATVLQRIRDGAPRPMADIGAHRPRNFWDRLFDRRPVTFMWRPVYGLLAVASCGLLLILAPAILPDAGRPVRPATAPQVLVQFRLEASGARHVSLAGTFTNWKPVHELHETAPGLWAITVPLPAGVHDYSFVVDGMRWLPDPYAPQIQDGFGGTSSRLALLTPELREL